MMKIELMKYEWALLMSAVGGLSSVMLGAAFAFLARWLCGFLPLDLPVGGQRGLRRRRACESSLFAALDPGLRYLGGIVAVFFSWCRSRGGKMRLGAEVVEAWQRKKLIRGGEPSGLHAYESIVLSLVLGAIGAGLAGLLGVLGRESVSWLEVLAGAIVGTSIFPLRLRALAARRFREMTWDLPGAIDLTALAMSAGADFPGALRKVTEGQTGVVAEELNQLLYSIELGITRRASLIALKERIPVQDVCDLVRAVSMAETKGASMTDALRQQAASSRQRRSVRGEEAAARAGVMLLFPVMLLMCCILIMLIGPMLVGGIGI